MAIFGWSSPKMAALYTRNADRKRLAAGAMHKLVPEQETDRSVPPEAVISSSGTNKGKKP
jgi:hypothetical protein